MPSVLDLLKASYPAPQNIAAERMHSRALCVHNANCNSLSERVFVFLPDVLVASATCGPVGLTMALSPKITAKYAISASTRCKKFDIGVTP
mmetsp:Transcript_37209/g.75365  ORF Transcript_37209/g.75365 Transcript_37209/m.75365 type:complete len:91 (+) Transcript_37209:245-517(+)